MSKTSFSHLDKISIDRINHNTKGLAKLQTQLNLELKNTGLGEHNRTPITQTLGLFLQTYPKLNLWFRFLVILPYMFYHYQRKNKVR